MNWNDDTESLTDVVKNWVRPWANVGSVTMSKSITLFRLRQVPEGRELKQTILGVVSFVIKSSPGFEDSEKKRYSCHLKVAIGLMWGGSFLTPSSDSHPNPHTKHGRQRWGPSVTTVISAGRISRVPTPTPRAKGQVFGGSQMADHHQSQAPSRSPQAAPLQGRPSPALLPPEPRAPGV